MNKINNKTEKEKIVKYIQVVSQCLNFIGQVALPPCKRTVVEELKHGEYSTISSKGSLSLRKQC